MNVKFTDLDRYPNGYTPASATDIKKTFARERKRLAEVAKKQMEVEKEATAKVSILRDRYGLR